MSVATKEKLNNMRTLLTATLLLFLTKCLFAQRESLNNQLGFSIPIIWNNSEATYYQLGSPKNMSGNTVSYGVNVNYSQPLYKSVYGKIGIGYFKQSFKIIRPFKYDSPIQLLYSTQSYDYNNLQLFVGIGYQKRLNRSNAVKCEFVYNYYSSFSQKYILQSPSGTSQINKKSLPLGSMINLDVGFDKMISKKISFGVDFILPVYTQWKRDEMFIYSFYSDNEQQIARNKFSFGSAFSIYYHF